MNEKKEKVTSQSTDKVIVWLSNLKKVPPANAQVWEIHRQAFLSQAADYVKELKTAPLGAGTKSVLLTSNASSMTKWRNILKENSIMAIALKALVILTLVFGGTFGSVSAAGGSVPGSPFYGFKMQLENWQLNTAHEPLRQAMLSLKFAQHRVDEAEKLMNQGDEIPSEIANRYQMHIQTALKAGDQLPEPAKEQLQTRIRTMLALHLQTLTQLRLRTCQECENDEPLQNMLKLMEQTQAQLQLQVGKQDGTPNPDPQGSGQGPGSEQGKGPEYQQGEPKPENQGEDNHGPGPNPEPGTPPDEPPGNGPESGPNEPDEPGNDEAPIMNQDPQGPGEGTPPDEIPGGPSDTQGSGDQDGTCSAGGNCGEGEGDENNGAGDNGGSEGGEPSGGTNSEGDNSGGDNGGSGGNGG